MSLTFTKIEHGERVAVLSDLDQQQAAALVWEAMHGAPYQAPAGELADAHAERPLAA